MRFAHLDHIGIAVKDFDAAVATYTALHGMAPATVAEVAGEQVRVAFFPVGPTKIELLAATAPESPIAKFIATRGPGLHHLCYAVVDFAQALRDLTAAGFHPIARPAQHGAEQHRIAFFHPKTTGGVLIEILEVSK